MMKAQTRCLILVLAHEVGTGSEMAMYEPSSFGIGV